MPTTFALEALSHGAAIQSILEDAFAADWPNRPASRLRAGLTPVAGLCLTALDGAEVVGTIRYYPVDFGHARLPGLMLGPLAVRPDLRGRGVAQVLARTSLCRARSDGWARVMLVGDPDYYARLDFDPAWPYGLTLAGADARLMMQSLQPGGLDGIAGPVSAGGRVRCAA